MDVNGTLPVKKNKLKTIGEIASIIIHPILLSIIGPNPFLACLPYGCCTKNKTTKVKSAKIIQQ